MVTTSDFTRKTKIGETERIENNRVEISKGEETFFVSRKDRKSKNTNYRVLENGMFGTKCENKNKIENNSDNLIKSEKNDFFTNFTESVETEIDETNNENMTNKSTSEENNMNNNRNIIKKNYDKIMRNNLIPCIQECSSIFSTEGHLFLIESSLRIKKKFDPDKRVGKYPICSFD